MIQLTLILILAIGISHILIRNETRYLIRIKYPTNKQKYQYYLTQLIYLLILIILETLILRYL